jgi:AraC-like DNA-binding protein
MSLKSADIFRSPDLLIRHVTCCPGHHELSGIERQHVDTLVFPLTGSFVQHLDPGREIAADCTTALFLAAGRPYRISHPGHLHDECLAVEFSSELLQSVLSEAICAETFNDPRLNPFAKLDCRAILLRTFLAWRTRRNIADALEAVEIAMWLLASSVRAAAGSTVSFRERTTTHQRHREQVFAVQSILMSSVDRSPSLRELSAQAATTPFHLSRIFRTHTGLSIHEYHVRVRLALAIEELIETDKDITAIALDHAFSSHSHFTHAFRRRTGLTPTAFRHLTRKGAAAQVSKIMTAFRRSEILH